MLSTWLHYSSHLISFLPHRLTHPIGFLCRYMTGRVRNYLAGSSLKIQIRFEL